VPITHKLIAAKRLVAAHGAVATLHFAKLWIDRQFRHAIFGTPLTWRKYDLINELSRIHAYRSILEISTARSGGSYDRLDRSRFSLCSRLSYLTADDWSDNAPIDYRSGDRNTADCMHQIRAKQLRFDMVFVDACHEYGSTRRDLQDALSLVNAGGIIVLHDCLPDDEALCPPTRGNLRAWCGVTYKAYLDVLMERNDLWYCTVDTDFGCGMICTNPKTRLYKRALDGDEGCIRAWRNVGDNYDEAFEIYRRNRDVLMNVVKVNDFLVAERSKAVN